MASEERPSWATVGGWAAPSAGAAPVDFGTFPAMMDAARQQTELVCWVAKKIHEHDGKLESLMSAGVTSRSAAASPLSRMRSSAEGPFPSLMDQLRKNRTPVATPLHNGLAHEDAEGAEDPVKSPSPDVLDSSATSEVVEASSPAHGARRDVVHESSSPTLAVDDRPAPLPPRLSSESQAAEAAVAAAAAARAKARAEGKSEAEQAAAAAGASAAFAARAAARATSMAAQAKAEAEERVLAAATAAAGGAPTPGRDSDNAGGEAESTAHAAMAGAAGAAGGGDVAAAAAAAATALRKVQALESSMQGHQRQTEKSFDDTASAMDQQIGALSEAIEGVEGSVDRKLNQFADFVRQQIASASAAVPDTVGPNGALSATVDKAIRDAVDRLLPERLRALDDEMERKLNDKFSTLVGQGLRRMSLSQDQREGESDKPVAAAAPASGGGGGGGLDSETMMALRMLQADVALRLPALEQSFVELRELRLQVPDIRNDLDELVRTTRQLSDAIELQAEALAVAGQAASAASRLHSKSAVGRVDSTDDLGMDEDGDAAHGAAEGAHPPAPAKPSVTRSNLAAALANYSKDQVKKTPEAQPTARISDEDLAAMSDTARRVKDTEQLVRILEDRLQELDVDFRATSAKTGVRLDQISSKLEHEDQENAKVSKVWNLANQVDVIQSLVNSEMNYIRRSVEHIVDRKLLDFEQQQAQLRPAGMTASPASPRNARTSGREGGGSPREGNAGAGSGSTQRRSGGGGVGRERSKSPDDRNNIRLTEVEEKLKFLQQGYQQNTLKIAGLKTAAKHVENQTATVVDQVKHLADEMESAVERMARQEVRMEFLSLHTGIPGLNCLVGDATKFMPAVNAATGGVTATLEAGRKGRQHEGKSAGGRSRRASASGATVAASTAAASAPPTPAGGTGPSALYLGLMAAVQHRLPEAPPRPESGDEASQGQGSRNTLATEMQAEANTQRIARLGKKVSDMDSNALMQFGLLREELNRLAHQIAQIVAFLPRRQRRTVEKIIAEHIKQDEGEKDGDKKDDDAEDKEKKKEGEGDKRRKINFSDAVEVRQFQVMEDSVMPWQEVGEPDQKWAWCHQGMNEMGRELAKHLEQMEHEKEEFEREVQQALERLQQDMKSRPMRMGPGTLSPTDRRSPLRPGNSVADDELDADSMAGLENGLSAEKMSKKLEKAIIPQLVALDERLERLSAEQREFRRAQEAKDAKKADKDELQIITMRLSIFERVDPRQMDLRLENLESSVRDHEAVHEQHGDRLHNVEMQSARRSDLTKARGEVATMKGELATLSAEVKNMTSSIYAGNRHSTNAIAEIRALLDKQITKLSDEKLDNKVFADLLEKVQKLELSTRDNRTILNGDGGGSEVNAVVKRIILNMEDKIMVLEKKVEALIESRGMEAERLSSPGASRIGSRSPPRRGFAEMQSVNAELEGLSQAIIQLKQDISISKVDLEHINEQGQHQMELAQRLNVLVEGASDEHGETGGTAALSLSRVQVMISAAARQLVAGSKWITKETFDLRLGEFRKEYLTGTRQLQAQFEELSSVMTLSRRGQGISAVPSVAGLPPASGPPSMPSAPPSSARLPKMKPKGGVEGNFLEWPDAAASPNAKVPALQQGPPKDRPGAMLPLPRASPRGGAAVILQAASGRPATRQ